MTKEEKELLLADLCGRLPYGVICDRLGQHKKLLAVHPYEKFPLEFDNGEYIPNNYELEDIKPYLRSLSNMTEEEKKEYVLLANHCMVTSVGFIHIEAECLINWLNERHFDYRGLIELGLGIDCTGLNIY